MTVCMFPGQGSQAKGMGKDLFHAFVDLTRSAGEILGYSIEGLCLEDPRKELSNTRFTQPAVYVVNALSWRRWHSDSGDVPAYLMGHSLGEYNALEASGAISFEDGLRLVQKRGALMAEAPPGSMAAVIGMTEETIREALIANGLQTIEIANLNAPNQTILSGLKEDIQRAATAFETDSVRYVPLNTGGAFHSRHMADARDAFEAFLEDFTFDNLAIPVISNVHAEPYSSDMIAATLVAQITQPVQWAKSVSYVLARGETTFEESGPGQVLTRLVDDIRQQIPTVESTPAPEAASSATPDAYDRDHELAILRQHIDDWNRNHPVGTKVQVEGYGGPLATRTKAVMLFGHRPAIYLESYNGYFALSDVQAT